MSGALLTFTPETHEYRLANGRRVPSVTEILRATGLSTDFEQIRSMGASRREAVDEKRDIGSIVHQDAHAFDDDDLDWSTVHPSVEPYLRAWATFRQNKRVVPVTRERVVYHARLGYCGTLDGIFSTPDGKRVLIDLKCGDPNDAGCRYQTEAYRQAYLLEHPDEHIDERWGVQLMPEAVIPYRIFPYTEWRDAQAWPCVVTTFYCGHAARSYR